MPISSRPPRSRARHRCGLATSDFQARHGNSAFPDDHGMIVIGKVNVFLNVCPSRNSIFTVAAPPTYVPTVEFMLATVRHVPAATTPAVEVHPITLVPPAAFVLKPWRMYACTPTSVAFLPSPFVIQVV